MKKFLGLMCSITLVLACTFTLFGCGKNKDKSTVMNVSLNPEVEFILDKDNKVVSVNALNEEGNLVINGQAFVGKSSDEAVKLFVEVSKETGFLVTGNIKDGENEINISISANSKKAKEIYNNVKSTVNKYFEDNNLTATVKDYTALTKEYLKQQVKECEKYLTDSELNNMSYEELVNTLQQSREETKEFLSQEIKEAYYQFKNDEVIQARMAYAKSQMNAIAQTTFTIVQETYKTACEKLEQARINYFVKEDSPYQTALRTLREKKTEYLNYRNYVAGLTNDTITTFINNTLENLNNALTQAETALNTAIKSCKDAMVVFQNTLTTTYNEVVAALNKAGVEINNASKEVVNQVNTAITNLKTSFSNTYREAITKAKNDWNNMKYNLIGGYKEA